MRRYQRISDDIPLISTERVPEFSPYTSGRNLAHFQSNYGGIGGGNKDNVVELFSQVPEPDKIQTIQEEQPAPYKESEPESFQTNSNVYSKPNSEKRPILNLFFVICLVLFIVICANFFTKTIENVTNNTSYIQYLIIALVFFLLAALFAWGLNL
jgi:hypothetical protein